MRAAVFQFDVLPDAAHNLERVLEGLSQAAAQGVDLVVLPEMWPTSFPSGAASEADLLATEEAWLRVGEFTAGQPLCVMGSGLGRTGGLPANRMRVFEAGAELLAYDKLHLFSPTAETRCFSAGKEPPPALDTRAVRLGVAVCYDLRFAGCFDRAWRAGVDLWALSAQWPLPRIGHWRALVMARAIERQCFFVACNRTGCAEIGRRRLPLEFPGASLIVSPLGEVLVEADGREGLFTADLDLSEARRYRTRIPLLKDERPQFYGSSTRNSSNRP